MTPQRKQPNESNQTMTTKIETVMMELTELCMGDDQWAYDVDAWNRKYKFAACPEMRVRFVADEEENIDGNYEVRIVLLTVGMDQRGKNTPVEAYLFVKAQGEVLADVIEKVARRASKKIDVYDLDTAPTFDEVDAICAAEGVAR